MRIDVSLIKQGRKGGEDALGRPRPRQKYALVGAAPFSRHLFLRIIALVCRSSRGSRLFIDRQAHTPSAPTGLIPKKQQLMVNKKSARPRRSRGPHVGNESFIAIISPI